MGITGKARALCSCNKFMVRPSGTLGLALLLAAGLMASAQDTLAQTPAVQTPQAATLKPAPAASATPARTAKAHAKKTTPVVEVPQAPPPPPTLEQQPPTPPQVSYLNGQLTIDSKNATLLQVLSSVQSQTGASVDIPPGAGSERVVARLGPGTPRDVLASLLNGSKFNYVILGEPNAGGVQKVILMAKTAPAGGTSAVNATQDNYHPPIQPQAVEPPEDEYPQNEPDVENQPVPGQPGIPGGEQGVPEGPNPGLNQAQPGVRTPEQMLQDLQRMQQQQQQYQQQLNPANQQPPPQQQQLQVPFPSQPSPVPQ
jgi:hypothetical protein